MLRQTACAEIKEGLLSPKAGYGWKEQIVEAGKTKVYVSTKDNGYKQIWLMKQQPKMDFDKKSDLINFYAGFKNRVNVVEEFGQGKEKFAGMDSYSFDMKTEKDGAESFLTLNVINLDGAQYIIHRRSTVVDPKVDEEMITLLKTLKF